jgi:hypothetical protein
MKRVHLMSVIVLFVMSGCGGNKQENLITVDVSKSYPEKELMLQNLMDVEYIPLETTDSFLTQGVLMAVGREVLYVKNRANDGDIFVFDRKTGKGLWKINRRGQSGEEYAYITELVLDEENSEIFVINLGQKILVYDLHGNYKRSFKATGAESHINTYNYDRDHLITYITRYETPNDPNSVHSYHVIISKQDGSITREISIPYKEMKRPVARMGEAVASPMPDAIYRTVPNHGNWVLMDASSDTLYNYLPDKNIKNPLIVRTPPILSMDPPEILLMPSILTDKYYFFCSLKLYFDFEKMRGFPSTELMYDTQAKTFFTSKVYNDDYTDKKTVDMSRKPVNQEIAANNILEAFRLVEDREKGLLKGRLKEIASTLNAESNPVIMLIKYKK